MSAPLINSVIVCDDIRKEVNGKDILIGVYSGDIVVTQFPYIGSLAFWIELHPLKKGVYDFRIRVSIDQHPEFDPIEISAQLHVTQDGDANVAVPGMRLVINKPAELQIDQYIDGKWTPIKKKKVLQLDSAASAERSTLPTSVGG